MSALAAALRWCAVVGAVGALAASGSSTANRPPPPGAQGTYAPPPPPSRPMQADAALGLWKSSFGPVKIERDEGGQVVGAWVYDRDGREIVGTFGGSLTGNVLQFQWQEPARPRDLVGEGYLVFDPSGQSFTGRWWTTARDRGGDWSGWRGGEDPAGAGPDGPPPDRPPSDEGPPDDRGDPRDGDPRDDGPRDDGRRDDGPREDGPAEQAPGPPPEDI